MNTHHDETPNQSVPVAARAGSSEASRPRHWGRWALAGIAIAGVLSLGACAHRPWSHDGDPAERVERAVDRIFSKVDATDEQKARITEIANAALRQAGPMRDEWRAARGQFISALTGEKVDRQALEVLRGERLAGMEKGSVLISTAMADIAEVLTPQQRQQVRERLEKHGDGRRGHWF
ncbi:MAG: Spy/CpxP family protein refolding chaperone [Burkholderiaceae bacterium]